MPNQEFPMAQYLQAYQNKYANDQAAKPDLGVALAGGITAGSNAGVNMWAQEKSKRQESTFNAAKDYFSKGEFYIKGTKDPLPPEQVSQFYEMLYDKKLKMKGNKDGTASFSTDKDVPFNIDWKPRTTEINTFVIDPNTNKPIITGSLPGKGVNVTPQKDSIRNNAETAYDVTAGRENAKMAAKAKNEYVVVKSEYDGQMKNLNEYMKLNENSYSGGMQSLGYKAIKLSGAGTDQEKFKNTAKVVNGMQNYVARTLKSTFGGQLSDSEREYLNGVYGALPNYTAEERKIAMEGVKNMLNNKLVSKAKVYNEYGGSVELPGVSMGQSAIVEKPTDLKPKGRFQILEVK